MRILANVCFLFVLSGGYCVLTMIQFDRVVSDTLKENVKSKLTFKGHLHTYRFCDDVWTFVIKDVNVKLDQNETINAEKIRIVACNAKKAGDV